MLLHVWYNYLPYECVFAVVAMVYVVGAIAVATAIASGVSNIHGLHPVWWPMGVLALSQNFP